MSGLNQFFSGIFEHPAATLLAVNPLLLLALVLTILPLFTKSPARLLTIAGRLIGYVDWISERLIDIVKWFAVAMVLVTAALVIGRYVFGVGSLKAQEAVIYFHAFLFLLSAGATLLHEGHVRVDVFYAKLSQKKQALINLLGAILFLMPVCISILLLSSSFVEIAWRIKEGSPEADGLHLVFILKSAIPFFATLMIMQGSALALRASLILNDHAYPAPSRQAGHI